MICDERFTTFHHPLIEIMSKKPVRVSISLPADDHAMLQGIAGVNQVSLSWLVRKAVRNLLQDTEQMRLFNALPADKRKLNK